MDLGLGRWIYMVLRQHGSAWCLSGPLKRLAFSRIISREAWETQNHQTFSRISLLGTLGPGDRRLCIRMRVVLVSFTLIYSYIIPLYETLHDRPFLLHLKRASETQNHLTFSYRLLEHQGTGYFMISNLCLCHLTQLHVTVALLIYVCAGYMCFVQL